MAISIGTLRMIGRTAAIASRRLRAAAKIIIILILLRILNRVDSALTRRDGLSLQETNIAFVNHMLDSSFLLFFDHRYRNVLLVLLHNTANPVPTHSLSTNRVHRKSVVRRRRAPQVEPASTNHRASRRTGRSSRSRGGSGQHPATHRRVRQQLFFGHRRRSRPRRHRGNGTGAG